MRSSLPLAALLAPLALLVPVTARAQRPDSTSRDSLPPGLDEQQRRVRGEATSQAASPRDGADAPPGRDVRWRAALGASVASAWGEGPNGLTVGSAPAPTLALAVAWRASRRLDAALALRGAFSGARLEDAAASWTPDGSVVVLDGTFVLERELPGRMTVRFGAGAALVSGPDGVPPFASAGAVAPLGEVGLAYRIPMAIPLHLVIGGQFLRYGAEGTAEAPAEIGTVSRLIVEVRHGR